MSVLDGWKVIQLDMKKLIMLGDSQKMDDVFIQIVARIRRNVRYNIVRLTHLIHVAHESAQSHARLSEIMLRIIHPDRKTNYTEILMEIIKVAR